MKRLLLTLIALSLGLALMAQDQGQGQRILAAKIGFLTEQLELSPEQASEFFPVYREFSQKRLQLIADERQLRKGLAQGGYDKAEAQQKIARSHQLVTGLADLEREYHTRFLTLLSTEQMAAYFRAEHQFRRELVRRYGQGGRGPRD